MPGPAPVWVHNQTVRNLALPAALLLALALTAEASARTGQAPTPAPPPPAATAVPSLPPPGRYALIAPPSQLTIYLSKAGWFSALGDNHVIIARRMRGAASRPPGAGHWTGFLTLPAAALRVADPGASARTRAEVQATMDSAGQLDIARFPRITWRLEALGLAADPAGKPGQIMLRGRFTLHGVTRLETWRTQWRQQGQRIHMWGQALLRLSDFGIRPIRRGLGAVQVKDQFALHWDIWWQRQP